MSDNSNSTGSTGSSTNSWTLLSPEEAAVESVGPVDDGTESLGDVPSLSEELAGAAAEFRNIDIPIETVLSEEGHQICQETTPEPCEGPIPSSPSRLSPLPSYSFDPPEVDVESQPPIIHDIVTSSPSDNENLGAIPFVTNLDLGTPLEIPTCELLPSEPEVCCTAGIPVSAAPVFDTPADIGPISEMSVEESPVSPAEPEPDIPTETLRAAEASLPINDDDGQSEERTGSPSPLPESEVPQCAIDHTPAPSAFAEARDLIVEKEEREATETLTQEEVEDEPEPCHGFDSGGTSGFDDGLRRRAVPTFEAPRPGTSDEEEEEEEEEMQFKIDEKKDNKPWLSVNKCVAAAVILLFLGSLFFSGDIDGSEVSDGEQSQEWLSGDPKEMKELLDKLTQENQQIAQLEAQLKSQKEALDLALKAVVTSGDEKEKADLEKENAKLKDELFVLPDLKKELETLRARVTELSALTASQEVAPATTPAAPEPGLSDGPTNLKTAGPERKDTADQARVKKELQRQKLLLEESRKRLETMKKHGSDRKQVRDNLAEIQKRLSEKVEGWGRKKPEESKRKGNKDKIHWTKEEKKEWRGEKDKKHRKDGGWTEKEEKSLKENSHKEAWRKNQDEWERKKAERKMDREERRKERPWHTKSTKKNQEHHHQQQKPHQHHDFWRDQEQKINRNIRTQLGCSSVEDCAAKERLYPVELSEFEELLEGYLSKLDDSYSGKDKIRRLTAQFFEAGVFIHDRMRFSDFAEDVADILEDAVDVLEGHKDIDSLEEEMEEFEREALWKFAATA